MSYQTLISATALYAMLDETLILDTRFQIADPSWGEKEYRLGHIPGAFYVHMNIDLADLSNPQKGRHPLPPAESFIAKLHAWGLSKNRQVVVVDQGGGMMAARAWWMIRHWLGHASTAVLDGGMTIWVEKGYPITHQLSEVKQNNDPALLKPHPDVIAHVSTLMPQALQPHLATYGIIDARAPDRFRGENETIDPVGGHIPSAINQFCGLNLTAEGRWKTPEELRETWEKTKNAVGQQAVVHQCGSGVTACHNWLAMEVAGIHPPQMQLYVGSWSEWCADSSRPIAKN